MPKGRLCVSCGGLNDSQSLFCARCRAAIERAQKPFYEEEDEEEEGKVETAEAAEAAGPESGAPKRVPKDRPKRKVLIIDDEVTITSALTLVLEEKNYLTRTAMDGLDGLAQACEWQPDLIILDVLMPKMTGYDFLQKLNEKTEARRVPVIIMSGREDMKNFFEPWDFYTFLVKPISLEDLLTAVDTLMARHEAQEEE